MSDVKNVEAVELEDEELDEVAGGINVEVAGVGSGANSDKSYMDKIVRAAEYKNNSDKAFYREAADKVRSNSDKDSNFKDLSIKEAADKFL